VGNGSVRPVKAASAVGITVFLLNMSIRNIVVSMQGQVGQGFGRIVRPLGPGQAENRPAKRGRR
jgi:hypothetical protein